MLRRKPDTTEIRKLLNWQAEHTLDDIIDDVANEIVSSRGR
jgi:hypothetical protein